MKSNIRTIIIASLTTIFVMALAFGPSVLSNDAPDVNIHSVSDVEETTTTTIWTPEMGQIGCEHCDDNMVCNDDYTVCEVPSTTTTVPAPTTTSTVPVPTTIIDAVVIEAPTTTTTQPVVPKFYFEDDRLPGTAPDGRWYVVVTHATAGLPNPPEVTFTITVNTLAGPVDMVAEQRGPLFYVALDRSTLPELTTDRTSTNTPIIFLGVR